MCNTQEKHSSTKNIGFMEFGKITGIPKPSVCKFLHLDLTIGLEQNPGKQVRVFRPSNKC
jgi:hypothetical protein